MIEYALNYGNGRLLGNLGTLIIINHPVIKAIIKVGKNLSDKRSKEHEQTRIFAIWPKSMA